MKTKTDQTHKERQQVTLVFSLHVARGPVCDTARLQAKLGGASVPGVRLPRLVREGGRHVGTLNRLAYGFLRCTTADKSGGLSTQMQQRLPFTVNTDGSREARTRCLHGTFGTIGPNLSFVGRAR